MVKVWNGYPVAHNRFSANAVQSRKNTMGAGIVKVAERRLLKELESVGLQKECADKLARPKSQNHSHGPDTWLSTNHWSCEVNSRGGNYVKL